MCNLISYIIAPGIKTIHHFEKVNGVAKPSRTSRGVNPDCKPQTDKNMVHTPIIMIYIYYLFYIFIEAFICYGKIQLPHRHTTIVSCLDLLSVETVSWIIPCIGYCDCPGSVKMINWTNDCWSYWKIFIHKQTNNYLQTIKYFRFVLLFSWIKYSSINHMVYMLLLYSNNSISFSTRLHAMISSAFYCIVFYCISILLFTESELFSKW